MAALPPPQKYIDALRAAGIKTDTARGFWGGVTKSGEIVVTTWIDAGEGPGRFRIWRPTTNHGALRDEWTVGNIRVGAPVKLIVVHQRGNVPLPDRGRQVGGARLMPGLWRVVAMERDLNGWESAIVERTDAEPMAA